MKQLLQKTCELQYISTVVQEQRSMVEDFTTELNEIKLAIDDNDHFSTQIRRRIGYRVIPSPFLVQLCLRNKRRVDYLQSKFEELLHVFGQEPECLSRDEEIVKQYDIIGQLIQYYQLLTYKFVEFNKDYQVFKQQFLQELQHHGERGVDPLIEQEKQKLKTTQQFVDTQLAKIRTKLYQKTQQKLKKQQGLLF